MPEPHLQWLLDDGLLVCPACGAAGAFVDVPERLSCAACESTVPVEGGVPDFFNGYVEPAAADTISDTEDRAVVDDIVGLLDLPDRDDVRADIVGALRSAARRTDQPELTAEIREVHVRFVGGDPEMPPIPPNANTDPTGEVERHYVPSNLTAGERRFVNVRFRNTGTSAWSSRTPPDAVTAAARFHRRSFGRRSTTSPTYTTLPIDIHPGGAITLPIEIEAPNATGRHELEIGLFLHPRGFVDSATVRISLDIHAAPRSGPRATAALVEELPVAGDYAFDHQVANQMVDAAIQRLWPDTERRVVEIGGSTAPQSWTHDRTNLVNVDISLPTLQLGRLYDRHHDRSIAHLCADATALPLVPGSFHAVTMYATLHHFSEPERLLRAAADLLLPGGFVAVMCEPTGTTLAHPAAIRDLLGGINEQTFAVDEYLWMAERAGLQVEHAVDHGGSFKAILTLR